MNITGYTSHLSAGVAVCLIASTLSLTTEAKQAAAVDAYLQQSKNALAKRLTTTNSLSLAASSTIEFAKFLTDGKPGTISATRQGPDIIFHTSPRIVAELEEAVAQSTDKKISAQEALVLHLAAAIGEAEALCLCDWPDYLLPESSVDAIRLATATSAWNLLHLDKLTPAEVAMLPGAPALSVTDLSAAGNAITYDAVEGIVTSVRTKELIELGKPDGAGDADHPALPKKAPTAEPIAEKAKVKTKKSSGIGAKAKPIDAKSLAKLSNAPKTESTQVKTNSSAPNTKSKNTNSTPNTGSKNIEKREELPLNYPAQIAENTNTQNAQYEKEETQRIAAELGLPDLLAKIDQAEDVSVLREACRELGQMEDPRVFSASVKLGCRPEIMDFEKLTPAQAEQSDTWLRLPYTYRHVSTEWLKYYRDQIYPRLQTLFSKLCVKEQVVQIETEVRKSRTNNTTPLSSVLDVERFIDPVLHDFIGDERSLYRVVLLRPADDVNPGRIAPGDKIKLEVSMYLFSPAYKGFFQRNPINQKTGVLHVNKGDHTILAHYYRFDTSHWIAHTNVAMMIDPMALTSFALGSGVQPYEINTCMQLHDVPISRKIAKVGDELEVRPSAIGQDAFTLQKERLVDKLLENKLIAPELEEHLRGINVLSYFFPTNEKESQWPTAQLASINNNKPFVLDKNNKIVREYDPFTRNLIEKLSPEELSLACVSEMIAHQIVHYQLKGEPTVAISHVSKDVESVLNAIGPYFTITALNLLGYGPYDEKTLIPEEFRQTDATRPMGVWDSTRNILNFNAPPPTSTDSPSSQELEIKEFDELFN